MDRGPRPPGMELMAAMFVRDHSGDCQESRSSPRSAALSQLPRLRPQLRRRQGGEAPPASLRAQRLSLGSLRPHPRPTPAEYSCRATAVDFATTPARDKNLSVMFLPAWCPRLVREGCRRRPDSAQRPRRPTRPDHLPKRRQAARRATGAPPAVPSLKLFRPGASSASRSREAGWRQTLIFAMTCLT